jgi:hypothetical protein
MTDSRIIDRLDTLIAEFRKLREVLEGRRVPRDERHAELVRQVARAAGEAAFSSSELIRHAQIDEALRAAIEACSGLSGRRLGRLLRRLEGVELGGHAIERCGEDSGGVIWLVKPRKVRLAIA